MRCYRCKKKDLKSAVRVMMPAKDKREKDAFRNICDDCYLIVMDEKGYVKVNNIWKHKPREIVSDDLPFGGWEPNESELI